MTEKIKVAKVFQVTTKTGIKYTIGVSGIKEFEALKAKIKSGKGEFVKLIDTCEIRRSEILSFEYYEQEIKEEPTND